MVEDIGDNKVGIEECIFVGIDTLDVALCEFFWPTEVTHIAVYHSFLFPCRRKHQLEYNLNENRKMILKQGQSLMG
jgi:hypothetical protein